MTNECKLEDDDDEELSSEELGWISGYDDKLADCPFPEGTKESDEWWEGYTLGSHDC